MVLGADAEAQRVALEAVLDHFRVDQRAGWTSARMNGHRRVALPRDGIGRTGP